MLDEAQRASEVKVDIQDSLYSNNIKDYNKREWPPLVGNLCYENIFV